MPPNRSHPVARPNSASHRSRLEWMPKWLHRKYTRWPDRLWKSAAVADCCLILGVHTFGLPTPPNTLTFAALLGVLVLAYFSAIACVMSR